MQYVYSISDITYLIGKVVIEPISQIITLYIHYETPDKQTQLSTLRQFLKDRYSDIDASNALHTLHTDAIHCCQPEPRSPSHMHVRLSSPITTTSLRKFFSSIHEFQSNPRQSANNLFESIASYFEDHSEAKYISAENTARIVENYRLGLTETDVQPVEQKYLLGLSEVPANFLTVMLYAALLAVVPTAIERSLAYISPVYSFAQSNRCRWKAA